MIVWILVGMVSIFGAAGTYLGYLKGFEDGANTAAELEEIRGH